MKINFEPSISSIVKMGFLCNDQIGLGWSVSYRTKKGSNLFRNLRILQIIKEKKIVPLEKRKRGSWLCCSWNCCAKYKQRERERVKDFQWKNDEVGIMWSKGKQRQQATESASTHQQASPKGRVGNDLYEPWNTQKKIAAYAKVNKTVYKNRHLSLLLLLSLFFFIYLLR